MSEQQRIRFRVWPLFIVTLRSTYSEKYEFLDIVNHVKQNIFPDFQNLRITKAIFICILLCTFFHQRVNLRIAFSSWQTFKFAKGIFRKPKIRKHQNGKSHHCSKQCSFYSIYLVDFLSDVRSVATLKIPSKSVCKKVKMLLWPVTCIGFWNLLLWMPHMTKIKLTYNLHLVIDLEQKDFQTVYWYFLALKNNPDQGGSKLSGANLQFYKLFHKNESHTSFWKWRKEFIFQNFYCC